MLACLSPRSITERRCSTDARRYEYGVYFDGVLQNYFPPAFGMITNIGNG